MPLAAWVATKWFVPFYRNTGEISAYTNLEKRFGPWARTYAVVCFLLTQFARMGTIFFGMALSLQALTGSVWAAGGIPLSVFALAHLPVRGTRA